MTFPELLQRVEQVKPGRIDAVGAAPYERTALEQWRQSGWQVRFHDGEISDAAAAAMDAAVSGLTDLLFCSGADNLKIVRHLNRYLERAAPHEYEPLSVMQALEVPVYHKILWVGFTPLAQYQTISAAINGVQMMVKTLEELGEREARVALLSCVEVISPNVASTVWEATLAHMSQRGQFGKARVDGPLGFDLAISPLAVSDKGVKTDVAGQADLLIPPDLNSYSSLVDAIHLSGEHDAAGIVVGGPVPVAMPPHRSKRHVDLSIQIASLLA